jgi:hypothetical protein
MRSFARPVVFGALALGLGAMSVLPGTAMAEVPVAPARCDWLGASTAPMTSLGSNQLLLRMKVEQDLGNPEATHGDEDTVQVNYGYESAFLSRYDIKSGTRLHVSGYQRQGGQCVVDTLNVATLEPGREGYVTASGVCLSPGGETISVAERASRSLGCAVSPALSLKTPTQPFQNGRMFYSRGIYVLQFGEMGIESGGTWSGVRDPFRDPEPEIVGMTPPEETLVEPRRGFGKTWRDLYAGPDGALGWGTEAEHTEVGNWQQFEKGLVIVLESGQGYILYYDTNTWEQRNR